jgi:hypothetical protein
MAAMALEEDGEAMGRGNVLLPREDKFRDNVFETQWG